MLYMIPAGLYCLYNNLAFVSLANFDPTTYYILLQFRMVVTGVVYEIVFKRKLSFMQWISLILITVGCLVKNSSQFTSESDSGSFRLGSFFSFSLFLVILQVFCSCFAGVYTEFLLKDGKGAQVHLMIQNVFMYIDSIICNFLVLMMVSTSQSNTFMSDPLGTFGQILFDPLVFLVMFNNSLCGIVTSLFLKSFNSILKIFASALELVITAVVCWILFSIPIDAYTVIAILIVSLATFIYSRNPMSSAPPASDGRPLPHQDVKYSPVTTKQETV